MYNKNYDKVSFFQKQKPSKVVGLNGLVLGGYLQEGRKMGERRGERIGKVQKLPVTGKKNEKGRNAGGYK